MNSAIFPESQGHHDPGNFPFDALLARIKVINGNGFETAVL
jgi:hypothetical protein